ncbi:MAG: hypothetical protein K6F00_11180 [Lachnospiraceae bacterium]|nr:hypothetical protein [Lachnospiraceae bacterium]
MMNKYYYFKEDNNLFRFRIEQDDEPLNPRFDWDGNIGTLNLWWSRCAFGDNKGNGTPRETLIDMVRTYVPTDKYTEEDLIYNMASNEMMILLQKYIVLIPCYIYEHSGFAISCSAFSDRWDSGMAGFIYTSKEKCEEQWGKADKDWRKQAYDELVNEVKEYDMYLKGECYYFKLEEYNEETDEWDDYECVGGFLTDKYGDDLVKYIKDNFTSEELISEDEALELTREIHKEFLIMDQANNIICI